MKIFELYRLPESPTGVWGVFYDAQNMDYFCVTGERHWKDNKKNESCIPPGEYIATLLKNAFHGRDVYRLENVPNRTDILIHRGAFPTQDSLGCILVGESFEDAQNVKTGKVEDAILDAPHALEEFMQRASGDAQIKIVIKNWPALAA